MIPLLIVLWGVPCTLSVLLAPKVAFYISLLIAGLATIVMLALTRQQRSAQFYIENNQAWLEKSGMRFKVTFLNANAWRLLATLEPDQLDSQSIGLFQKIADWLARRKYLCIYHSTLSKERFCYIRSFASYQVFTQT